MGHQLCFNQPAMAKGGQFVHSWRDCVGEGEREGEGGGREGGKSGGREGERGRKEWREGGREGGKSGGREGGREERVGEGRKGSLVGGRG